MKISLNWLNEYCNLDWTPDQLVEKLTMSGAEVESIKKTGVNIPNIITAKILSSTKHPNADRLSVCQVTDGKTTRQIVCGASNYKVGDIVPLALPGANLPGGFTIKESKLRGETSQGMMCSSKELELAADAAGLLILPEETPLGRPINEIFPGDTIIEIEVTPNRADLLSYRGIVRELTALGLKPKPFPSPEKIKFSDDKSWQIKVESPKKCLRYTAQLFTNLKVSPSPQWMRERLESIGLRAINNIVDITNYVLFELGQPLHAFDAATLIGNTVCIRQAKTNEEFTALDGKTYKLNTDDLVIADTQKAIALAGVMGGEHTGVTEKTTSVLLESAIFNPTTVRATSRRLGLISDSSYRFERGLDPALIDAGRERAAQLIVELTGATKHEGAWQSSSYTPPQITVSFRPERARTFVSADISDEKMKQILTGLGCESIDTNQWKIPTWRPDLTREIDLVEEIIRIHGLDSVKRRAGMSIAFSTETDAIEKRNRHIREILTSIGFYEIMTGSMLPAGNGQVKLFNPMNEENACLRPNLLENALACVEKNLSREQRDLRIFEIGRIYLSKGSATREETHLLLIGYGRERLTHWTEEEKPFNYFSLKGIMESLSQQFPDIQIPEKFGLVDSVLLKKFGIKIPVYAAEIILPEKIELKDKKFAPLPQYPAVTRDLAFVVDQKINQDEIFKAIRSANIPELENVKCFDLFHDKQGKKLSAEKKSLAYALTYRSNERTLNENEVAQWERKIIETVKRSTGAELRA